ncbi:MAG: VanZ family protein [Lachnospiraceae bacterium]|nr:VanZ family protein [Lachnospiraceae bacterium]
MKKIFSVVLLTGWIGFVLFLSFQNGEDTSNTSLNFTQKVLHIFIGSNPDWGILMLWDKRFRLTAHFALFFLYGIISMLVLMQWRKHLLTAGGISAASGIFLSVLSEVGKLPIQGRHCDFLEMGLNMAGAAAGTAVVMVSVWLLNRINKK